MSQLQSDLSLREDSELMLAYIAGDVKAFELLYQQHRKGLMRFFYTGTGVQALALELFQETWTRVVKARHQYVASARFSTWLYSIARHCLIDHFRKHSRHDGMDEFSDEDSSGMTSLELPLQPDEIALLAEKSERLQSVLDRLPEVQRDVILLRHIAGMSVPEIALVVEENPETIKSRLRYAISRMRSALRVKL